MRCQSCDKNEATTTVICDNCQAYYASIREGQFREQELTVGEHHLSVTSWISVPAPASKKALREEKAVAKKRGLFAKRAAPEPEAEPEPPPDWKNRVFPSPDADLTAPAIDPAAAAAAAAAVGAAGAAAGLVAGHEAIAADVEVLEHAHEGEGSAYAMGPENFSYGLAHEEEAQPEATLTETSPAEAPAIEPAAMVDPEVSRLERTIPQTLGGPEGAVEPAPAADLTNFLDSLTAAPNAGPAVAADVEALPSADLASFFDSLAAPPPAAAGAQAAEATPFDQPAVPDGLASFFESLAAPNPEPQAPVVEAVEPQATEVPMAGFPAVTELPSFTEMPSLFETAAANGSAMTSEPANAETAAPFAVVPPVFEVDASAEPEVHPLFESVASPAPEAPPVTQSMSVPVSEVAPTSAAAELSDFFASLAASPAPQAASPVAEPTAEPEVGSGALASFFDSLALPTAAAEVAASPALQAPASPVPSTDLTDFFNSLSTPAAPTAPAAPPEVPPTAFEVMGSSAESAVSANPAGSDARSKPFSIEIQMPGAEAAGTGAAGGRSLSADSLRPPTVGQPFSIDLGGPPVVQPPKVHSPTDDLKRAHSQGGLAFVAGDEEADQATGFGLLDGLAYDKTAGVPYAQQNNSGARAPGAHDDDDDTKTIDL